MLIGNILMFVPLGFLLPFVAVRINQKNIFLLAIVVPVVIEFLQLFLGRSFDVDDLICNFIGIVIGFFTAWELRKLRRA